MFFRKKMKLQDFLEGPFLDVVLSNGSFRYEDFYEDFQEIVNKHPLPNPEQETHAVEGDAVKTRIDRDYFISSFLGAFLWLLKYRTLSTNRNSPRKLAFLDLLFDIEVQKLIGRHLTVYDVDRVHEVYDLMDILCKKQYTGKLPEGEPPPFLVSPIWDKKANPYPLTTAAVIFRDLIFETTNAKEVNVSDGQSLVVELVKWFTEMTAPIEKQAANINFTWATPKEGDESNSDSQQQG